jgi:hypothetical protein
MKFKDVLNPGMEAIQAARDCVVGGRRMTTGQIAEVPAAAARQAVQRRDARYATRCLLKDYVGPVGDQGVEPGKGSIVWVSSWEALAWEKAGKAEPAPPLEVGPMLPSGCGPLVRIKVAAPKKPPAANPHFYAAGIFVPALGRFVANGEEPFDCPEDFAKRAVDAGFAVLA